MWYSLLSMCLSCTEKSLSLSLCIRFYSCSPFISLPRIFLFCNRLAHNIHFLLFQSVDCGISCASCQCTHTRKFAFRSRPNILVVYLYLLICFHRFVNPQLVNFIIHCMCNKHMREKQTHRTISIDII